MKCPRCSKEYDDSFAYCPHCTEPKLDLTQASLQPPQPEQQASQPIPPSEGEPAVPATSVADGKPSWLSRKKIVVIGVCVLLVIGLAVGLAVGLSGGGKKITESTTTIPRTPELCILTYLDTESHLVWTLPERSDAGAPSCCVVSSYHLQLRPYRGRISHADRPVRSEATRTTTFLSACHSICP
jgi:hypothetical protein